MKLQEFQPVTLAKTATELCGTKWSDQEALFPIKRTLHTAFAQLNTATHGITERPTLKLNPSLAGKLAQTPEVQNYKKGKYHTPEEEIGGLPPNIYGFPIELNESLPDDAVIFEDKYGSKVEIAECW